ncbi:MAG: aspartate 1-decarboxylase [Planctomycetota bacterium]
MLREMMKSKIHGAVVTQCDVAYLGSLSIDRNLMDEADILPNEKVQVVNLNNGERFETYAIVAPRGSKVIGLNGGAALKGKIGDRLLVITYAHMTEEEARTLNPRLVLIP